jgi:hypothetical protein
MNAIPIPAPPEREEPIFCMVLAPRPRFERPASLSEPIDFARRLVADLFTGSALSDVLDPATLRVIIGDGNWISYECSFWAYLKCDSNSLKPCLARSTARKILRLARAPHRQAWFRTRTRPSLHYFVVLDEGRLKVRGHVDAASPFAGPVTHFLRDYLPARGIGAHPTAETLWNTRKLGR